MLLKKWFQSKNFSKLTHDLQEKAQSFFEPQPLSTTASPATKATNNFVVVPQKQLGLFIRRAVSSKKQVTITLALKEGTTETLTGQLFFHKTRYDILLLQISDKQTRIIFKEDIIHLSLDSNFSPISSQKTLQHN